jgi:hypothetical protein
MGVRSGSSYRIVDADGKEHWVPMGKQRRQGSPFWRGVLVLTLLLAGGGAIAHSLPVSQVSDGEKVTVRTLAPTSTAPTTTQAVGPLAIACNALGFK